MASWIDDLAGHAAKSAKKKQPAKPRPKIERVIVTIRPSDPDSGDPGSARFGYYFVEGDLLTMCDENGSPLKTDQDALITVVLENAGDAHGIAASLVRKRSRGSSMKGFERGALKYPDEGGWR
jgi:hypothetical protein